MKTPSLKEFAKSQFSRLRKARPSLRIGLWGKLSLRVGIDRAPQILVGFSFLDFEYYWVFCTHLTIVKIELYTAFDESIE